MVSSQCGSFLCQIGNVVAITHMAVMSRRRATQPWSAEKRQEQSRPDTSMRRQKVQHHGKLHAAVDDVRRRMGQGLKCVGCSAAPRCILLFKLVFVPLIRPS